MTSLQYFFFLTLIFTVPRHLVERHNWRLCINTVSDMTINSNKYWDFHHIYRVSNEGIKTQEITIWLRMLADSPKPEAYHSQPGLDKYFQHNVMLRLTIIIVMFTSITVIIFASMIIKSILKLQTMHYAIRAMGGVTLRQKKEKN